MDTLRSVIYSITGILLFAGVLEILLPEGNMRKYASVLMGLVVVTGIISLFTQVGDIKLAMEEINYKIDEEVWQEQLHGKVTDEYVIRLEALISEKGGDGAKVVIDEEMRIVKITLNSQPGTELMSFLTQEMGVMSNDIEVK